MSESLWVVRPPIGNEAAECARLHRLAIERRWARPQSRGADAFGPRVWLNYWQAKETEVQGGPRTVPPHMPGGGPSVPEDASRAAARIAANVARWRGWPWPEGEDAVPDRRAWERELGCFGYFGFGGGYASIAERKTAPGYGLYCNVCPRSQSCWTEHRARVRELVPDLMAEFDRMAAEVTGPELMRRWWEAYEIAPPDVAANAGNMEDGMACAAGEGPKDRGEWTLSWPLTPRGGSPDAR